MARVPKHGVQIDQVCRGTDLDQRCFAAGVRVVQQHHGRHGHGIVRQQWLAAERLRGGEVSNGRCHWRADDHDRSDQREGREGRVHGSPRFRPWPAHGMKVPMLNPRLYSARFRWIHGGASDYAATLDLQPPPHFRADPRIKAFLPAPASVKPTVHQVIDQLGNIISAQGQDAGWVHMVHSLIHENWVETQDSEERARLGMCAAFLFLNTYFSKHQSVYKWAEAELKRRGIVRIG